MTALGGALKGAAHDVDAEGVEMLTAEHFVHGTTGDRLTAETLGGDVILVERRMSAGGWEPRRIKRLPRRRGRQAQIDRFLGRRRDRRAAEVRGGGGSRTRVFRAVSGASPSAADGEVSGDHHPSASVITPASL